MPQFSRRRGKDIAERWFRSGPEDPPAQSRSARVRLLLEDGTMTLPPAEGPLAERFSYLADELFGSEPAPADDDTPS